MCGCQRSWSGKLLRWGLWTSKWIRGSCNGEGLNIWITPALGAIIRDKHSNERDKFKFNCWELLTVSGLWYGLSVVLKSITQTCTLFSLEHFIYWQLNFGATRLSLLWFVRQYHLTWKFKTCFDTPCCMMDWFEYQVSLSLSDKQAPC